MSLPIDEEWRPVPGLEDRYDVSNHGRVRSWAWHEKRGGPRTLSSWLDTQGYPRVSIWDGVEKLNARVHVLAASAFLGPRPDGAVIRHLDGNPQNNTPTNLAYGTVAENVDDSLRHGTNREARKARCVNDHPFDDANTYRIALTSSGGNGRRCRTCDRERARAYRARKRTTRRGA